MSLKIIALISGGKDSLFSILHCLANNHTIVALANLYPPLLPANSCHAENAGEGEDLNSYMYQTVGHSIIPLYAEALEIPLYRQEILGSAVRTERDYAAPSTANVAAGEARMDETESLVPLLKKVIEAHPDANAVSTGAILSTYQRTRVESVAIRLGLVPLSYLWQYTCLPPYSQSALLEDMGAVWQDARIIKVASGGLDSGFLWDNVADPKIVAKLKKAVSRFGEPGDGAVLGEGGEFETLAIDGPGELWKKRIEVDVNGSVAGDGGSAIARLKGGRVVEKEVILDQEMGLKALRIPKLLDDEFETVLQALGNMDDQRAQPSASSIPKRAQGAISITTPRACTMITKSLITITNLTSSSTDIPASDQLLSILDTLHSNLAFFKLPPSAIIHTTLLLRHMSDFTALNPIYGSFFPDPNPPSRVTVACGDSMPNGVHVMLNIVANKTSKRRGLHVQGRSYWAPANIGPYSQAVSQSIERLDSDGSPESEDPEVVYVAGQIPLVPASMEIVSPPDIAMKQRTPNPPNLVETQQDSFKIQTTLALQHLWRIGRAMRVGWWTGSIAFISDCTIKVGDARAHTALTAWTQIHKVLELRDQETSNADDDDEDDAFDVWDLKYGHGGPHHTADTDIDARPRLPDPHLVNHVGHSNIPPCFVVQVEQLPRRVDVEWSSVGVCDAAMTSYYDADSNVYSVKLGGSKTGFAFVTVVDVASLEGLKHRLRQLDEQRNWGGERGPGMFEEPMWEHVVVYTAQQLPGEVEEWMGMMPQVVPCRRVWGLDGGEVGAVVVVRQTEG